MEPMEDWEGDEPMDDPVYSDHMDEEQPMEVCTRPQVYTADELFGLLSREINNRIITVFPVIHISQAVAMLLQRNFQFERILQDLSTNSIDSLNRKYSLRKESTTNMRVCLVCEQKQRGQMSTCCNMICSVCLQQYVEGEIQKNELLIRCPNSDCGAVLPFISMQPALVRRYEKKLGVAYAKSLKSMFENCLDCELYIRIPPMRLPFLQCHETCGCRICLSCHTFCHRPLSCEEVVKWSARIVAEGLSMQYITKNTKKCPNCHVNIEKNEGCNHMTCRQCKHQFCWICFVDWKTHCMPGYKGCTKFEEKKVSSEENDKQKFYFYCQRYQVFEESEQAAYKLRNGTMAERIKQFETVLEHPKDDFDFFRTGVNCVIQVHPTTIQGRRAIKYLYAFLCIGKLNKSVQEIVEHNLSTAQHNLEHLHGLIESAIRSEQMHDFETYDKMRFEIRNYSSVTDRFLQNIADELSK